MLFFFIQGVNIFLKLTDIYIIKAGVNIFEIVRVPIFPELIYIKALNFSTFVKKKK